MTSPAFIILSILLLIFAMGVLTIKDPVRCALAGAAAFITLGLLFIAAGAEFLGFVQLLVNVGAVAILIVFVILLTRPSAGSARRLSPTAKGGLFTAVLLLTALGWALWHSPLLMRKPIAELPEAMIAPVGERLVSTHLLPLEVVAILLTAALIGAVLFVWDEPKNTGKLNESKTKP